MSGWVGLQLAGPPPAPAWLSVVSVGRLFLEGCAIWDEPDSGTSAHPASTRTNKDAASTHPNHILLSRATMVDPSLRVTVCVCCGNRGPAHRGTAVTDKPGMWSSLPSTFTPGVSRLTSAHCEQLSFRCNSLSLGAAERSTPPG